MTLNPYEAPQSIPPPEPIRWPQRLTKISISLSAILLLLTLLGEFINLKSDIVDAFFTASPYFLLLVASRFLKRSQTLQTGFLVAAVPALILGSLIVISILTYDREPGPDLMGVAMASMWQLSYMAIVAAITLIVRLVRS